MPIAPSSISALIVRMAGRTGCSGADASSSPRARASSIKIVASATVEVIGFWV